MPSTKSILKAALLVGTLDILAAFVQYLIKTGKTPFRPVLTFIASGLLGKEAFTLGDSMVLPGLLIHYLIAAAFTLLFFLTVARLSFAREQKLLAGILYGAFVWMAMNLLVLPFTKAPTLPKDAWSMTIGFLIITACVGIPLSYMASRSYHANQRHHRTLKNFLK